MLTIDSQRLGRSHYFDLSVYVKIYLVYIFALYSSYTSNQYIHSRYFANELPESNQLPSLRKKVQSFETEISPLLKSARK